MEIISRKEALARGMNKFFTGKPCKNGHIEPRRIHNSVCMGCIRVAGRKWYAKNTAHKLQKSKEVYQKNKENVLARTRLYQINNKERARAWSKEWAKRNPERAQEAQTRWRKKNPGIVAAWVRAAQAKRKNSYGSHTYKDIMDRFRWQHGCCAACRKALPKKFEVDHYIPLAKGGHNNPSNIQLLCPPCNRRKHAKDPIAFYQSLGLLL